MTEESDLVLEVIKGLARRGGTFTSDDIRPLLPGGFDPLKIPSAVQGARRKGLIEEVGRVRSTIPERKGSLVAVFKPGPGLVPPQSAPEAPKVNGAALEEIEQLRLYLEARGHLRSRDEVAGLMLLIAARSWTILAGPSGTGKSSIVALLSDAFKARFVDIQVKRNWTSSEDCLGYYSELLKAWLPGPLLTALETHDDRQELTFVRFDEMNLAPPEYYLAEVLSASESWQASADGLQSAPIQLPPSPAGTQPPLLRLNNGTHLFGTVNIDETTQQLSPKMLDRAAVVTFEEVDLASIPEVPTTIPTPPDLAVLSNLLRTRPRDLRTLGELADPSLLDQLIPLLTLIDSYTRPLGYPIGYRQRDGLYILLSLWRHLALASAITLDDVLDLGVRSMILPKLQGQSPRLRPHLLGLASVLANQELTPEGADLDALSDQVSSAKFPRSYQSVLKMLARLESVGYFDFW